MLQEITRLDIDYLYHLDYVDIKSLSFANKDFNIMLNDDTTLKNILYEQCNNYIYLPPKFPILKALNELYNIITVFTYKLYPDDMKWPRWINIEMFRNDLKRNIYSNLYYKITDLLYCDRNDILDMNLIIDKMKIINLDKIELIFPFCAYNDDFYLTDTNICENKFYLNFNKELHLSDTVLDYFRYSFLYLFNKYNKYNVDIENNLLNLLFIRNYSYRYDLEV